MQMYPHFTVHAFAQALPFQIQLGDIAKSSVTKTMPGEQQDR